MFLNKLMEYTTINKIHLKINEIIPKKTTVVADMQQVNKRTIKIVFCIKLYS